MKRRKLLLCTGSHCKKKLHRHEHVEKTLARLPAEVSPVGCQKVCDGPVVGVSLDGRWQWFARMDSTKALDALADLLERDEIGKPLKKRWNTKRSGQRRR